MPDLTPNEQRAWQDRHRYLPTWMYSATPEEIVRHIRACSHCLVNEPCPGPFTPIVLIVDVREAD